MAIGSNGTVRPCRSAEKAFDILAFALVERAGEVVGKAELLQQVWPDSVADDGSLRFHVTVLRKVLGDGRFIRHA